MAWSDKIYSYCERGHDPGFWAEPANAVSNGAFVLAALIAFAVWRNYRAPPGTRSPGLAELLLILLVAVIGIGSFLFHTLATRWAVIADTAPIGVFMLAYLGYAGMRFLRVGWLGAGLLLALFVAAQPALGLVHLPYENRLGVTAGYMPALYALGLIGLTATMLRRPAGPWLLAAAAVFAASLYFRTIDRDVCAATHVAGHTFGTHFIWHILNAALLLILLLAALRHGRRRAVAGRPV